MQTIANFAAVLTTQGQALETMMTNQVTANPQLMDEAKELLGQAICKAIQASNQTTDTTEK